MEGFLYLLNIDMKSSIISENNIGWFYNVFIKKKSYQWKHTNKRILLKCGEAEKRKFFFLKSNNKKNMKREFRKKSIIYNNDFWYKSCDHIIYIYFGKIIDVAEKYYLKPSLGL